MLITEMTKTYTNGKYTITVMALLITIKTISVTGAHLCTNYFCELDLYLLLGSESAKSDKIVNNKHWKGLRTAVD